MFARVHVIVISLKSAALEAPKCFPSVMETLPRPVKRDSSYASWPHYTVRALGLRGLILDIHDARRKHGSILAHRSKLELPLWYDAGRLRAVNLEASSQVPKCPACGETVEFLRMRLNEPFPALRVVADSWF
jgi:hypothetical protein